jgi:hypothetical protein
MRNTWCKQQLDWCSGMLRIATLFSGIKIFSQWPKLHKGENCKLVLSYRLYFALPCWLSTIWFQPELYFSDSITS